MIRERCSCSAEIETDEEDAFDIVDQWRVRHHCSPDNELPPHTSGFAQIEQAPDFTSPELHIGFRQFD